MPISEAKKRSNVRWDAANMKNVACRVRRETADQFAEEAKANGTTPNELIRGWIAEYLKSHTL